MYFQQEGADLKKSYIIFFQHDENLFIRAKDILTSLGIIHQKYIPEQRINCAVVIKVE